MPHPCKVILLNLFGCSIIKAHLFHFCGFKHFEDFFKFLEILVKHFFFFFVFLNHMFLSPSFFHQIVLKWSTC
jgi:hypothetical protein